MFYIFKYPCLWSSSSVFTSGTGFIFAFYRVDPDIYPPDRTDPKHWIFPAVSCSFISWRLTIICGKLHNFFRFVRCGNSREGGETHGGQHPWPAGQDGPAQEPRSGRPPMGRPGALPARRLRGRYHLRPAVWEAERQQGGQQGPLPPHTSLHGPAGPAKDRYLG